LSGCRIRSNLTDENKRYQGTTRRQCHSTKERKSAKAKRILIETDVHHRGYQAARKVDNGVIENRAPGRSIPTKDSMCGSDPDVPINK
jgi:hypothetical protein